MRAIAPYRLVICDEAGERVEPPVSFTSFEQARARIGPVIRARADAAGVRAVKVQRAIGAFSGDSPLLGLWETEQSWGTAVMARIQRQHATRISAATVPAAAAAPPPTSYRSQRRVMILTTALVLVLWAGIVVVQTGGRVMQAFATAPAAEHPHLPIPQNPQATDAAVSAPLVASPRG